MFERQPDYGDIQYDYYTERPQDLKPLKSLDGWKIADNTTDIRGMDLFDHGGNEIGKIDDLLMSMSAHEAIFAIVHFKKGLFGDKKESLIPLDHLNLDRDNKRILFDGTLDHFGGVPEYNKDVKDYGVFYDHWSGIRSTPGYAPRSERQEFRHYVSYPEGLEEEEEIITEEERTRRHIG